MFKLKCLFLFFFVAVEVSFAQQHFSVYDFRLPTGFTLTQQSEMATASNNASGQAIALFRMTKGDPSPESNFTTDWNVYVTTQGKLTGPLDKSSTTNGNGWTVVTGQSTLQIGSNQFYVQLKTFTKDNQKTSLLFLARSADQEKIFRDFLAGCNLQGKPVVLPVATASTNTVSATTPVGGGSYVSYGNMFYKLPSGWKVMNDASGSRLKLMPGSLKQNENLYVALLQPAAGATDLNTVAADTWAMLGREANDNFVDGWKTPSNRIMKTLQGFDYIRLQKQTKRLSGLDIVVDLILVKTPAGIERIALFDFELRAQGMDYSPASCTEYFYPIEGLISTIQFKQKPLVDIANGTVKGNEPVGVWCGLTGSYNGVTGTYGQAESFLVLLSNGKVYLYRTMPKGGLANLNTLMHQQLYADYWADYNYAGAKGSFTNSYYKRIDFSIAGGKMKLIKNGLEHNFFKLPSFDNAKINGTYGFSTGQSITFTSAGRFTDQGVLHIIAHDLYFEAYQPTTRPGSGTYEIRDYSIIFKYDDGRIFQTAFTDYGFNPSDPSPAALMLSENMDVLMRK